MLVVNLADISHYQVHARGVPVLNTMNRTDILYDIMLYLSAGFKEASKQVWCPAFSVETNDCLQDVWVFPPVQRLEVVGCHDEKLLLTRNIGKEHYFLGVTRLEQRPHGLFKKDTLKHFWV